MNIVLLPHGRIAVRDGDTLLAVPPMHPGTSAQDRQKVLEYVLRRQIGLAHTIAEMARDDLERHLRIVPELAHLIQQTPHHTPKAA